MPSLHPAPRLSAKGPGRLVYGAPPAVRLCAGALAVSILLFGPAFFRMDTLRILAWIVAFFLGFSALSVDLWIFQAAPVSESEGGIQVSGKVERRFGLLLAPRKWSLPRDKLSRLELRSGGPGETLSGDRDQQALMEARLLGIGRGSWSALVLRLEDGRAIALAAGPARLSPRFAADGERIGALLGLPLVK